MATRRDLAYIQSNLLTTLTARDCARSNVISQTHCEETITPSIEYGSRAKTHRIHKTRKTGKHPLGWSSLPDVCAVDVRSRHGAATDRCTCYCASRKRRIRDRRTADRSIQKRIAGNVIDCPLKATRCAMHAPCAVGDEL